MRLRIGLPVGSLNTADRADTRKLLLVAGHTVEGYEHGQESELRLRMTPEWLEPHLVRPQSLPIELSMGLMDAGIGGEDWFAEEIASGSCPGLAKLGAFDYGFSRLVIAIPRERESNNLEALVEEMEEEPIICFTEYPYLMRAAFTSSPAYQRRFGTSLPLIQIRGAKDGDNFLVRIVNSEGITEAHMAKGASMIMDHTKSGRTLEAYGLKEVGELMHSSAAFYVGPSCTGEKLELANAFYEGLARASSRGGGR